MLHYIPTGQSLATGTLYYQLYPNHSEKSPIFDVANDSSEYLG